MPANDGGLGSALVGEKIVINTKQVAVTKLLGEGGFSYVYLVKELADTAQGGTLNNTAHGGSSVKTSRSGSNGSGTGVGNKDKRSGSMGKDAEKREMVLKVTSILSRQQRDIAEKEAKLLSRLAHPSIIKMYDTCYRTTTAKPKRNEDSGKTKERPQHLILMEFCEGGHALDVCANLAAKGERFDLSSLIIAFGQICNAVSYLHAQRPPIVHRDLKPANFLIKNGAYKLCDFGSAVFGHVDLKTSEARYEAEEVIQKTTTQMFRAPEMVDLFMAKKLTQATDVWALGCCLYSLAFLQNCFEEGSNLAILSRKYKIPDDNPYGDGLVELLDRMLTVDSKARADMTEVILCLSAVYSGRSLPPRKDRSKKKEEKEEEASKAEKTKSGGSKHKKKPEERVGTFRTDGQGIYDDGLGPTDPKRPVQAKKLDPNSAAARRKISAQVAGTEFAEFPNKFGAQTDANPDVAFPAPTGAFDAFDKTGEGSGPGAFASFEISDEDGSVDPEVKGAFLDSANMWGAGAAPSGGEIQFNASFASFGEAAAKASPAEIQEDGGEPGADDQSKRRSGGAGPSRLRRNVSRDRKKKQDESSVDEAVDDLVVDEAQEEIPPAMEDTNNSERKQGRRAGQPRTSRVRRATDGRNSSRRGKTRDEQPRSKSRDRKTEDGEENGDDEDDDVVEE
ncbi:hypothetical protein ACA910_007815 [Epithemia clementina (nom. ined.)]